MAVSPRLDFESFVARQRAAPTPQSTAPKPPEPSSTHTKRDPQANAYAYKLDRQSRQAFDNARPVALAVEASVRLFKTLGQHQLLGSAVKVGDKQFPRIHSLTRTAADALAIPIPDVFILNNPTFNAGTFGTNDNSFITIHSGLVDAYSDEELLAVIGHECGHIHNAHVAYLTALHYLTYMAGMFLPWVLQPALVALRLWSRRAEVTCDRAGMLVTKDHRTVERAIAKLAVGSSKLYAEFNVDAFLEQHAEAGSGVGKYVEIFATHPWLPKRLLAMRVFAQSRLYGEAASVSNEGLTMNEVDTRVAALLAGHA